MTLSTAYLILAEAWHRRRVRTRVETYRRSNQRLAVLAARPQAGSVEIRPPILTPPSRPALLGPPPRTTARPDIITAAVEELLDVAAWGPGRDKGLLG